VFASSAGPITVLGIDPGLTRCGYAVLEGRAQTPRAVALGVIRTPATMELPHRLAALQAELGLLLSQFRPDAVAVEHVFFQTNVRTAMSVGQASGLALAAAAAAGCDVMQFTPNEVKSSIAGRGRQGPGPADGAGQAGVGHRAETGRRGRRRRAGAVLLGGGAHAPTVAGGGRVIGSLRGTVLERTDDSTVLLEVAGVGFVVHVTPRTLAELEPSTTAFLYVHHHIREDAQLLFGFLRGDERSTFQQLIATHGIGPALAMAILGTHAPLALADVVASNDLAALTMVPGVGKKTAERLLVELRNRLNVAVLDPIVSAGGGSAVVSDVREALAGLGYGPEEVREVLREISSGGDASTMLRDALKILGAKRA
jgi:Holliday junction DNA helicase RuvA